MIFSFFTFCFNTLDSITMYGFSLLDYLLAMIILPIGVSLFVAIVQNSSVDVRSSGIRGEHEENYERSKKYYEKIYNNNSKK